MDARSARRLVPLELADVNVPPLGAARSTADLFFRVLRRNGGALRIELWERGEFYGARSLNVAGENPQLLARRVALASAELARRLARRREATLARDARVREARLAREWLRAQRTQDGPVALRSELGLASVPSRASLFGVRSGGEFSLYGPLRLDVSAEAWGGALQSSLKTELYGVALGPAYRLVLTRSLDLDLGARAAAFIVQAPGAASLDGVPRQMGSWTALVGGTARLQLRLTRQLRASLGVDAGPLLRSMSYVTAGGDAERLSGWWWSGSLGLVVTPRR